MPDRSAPLPPPVSTTPRVLVVDDVHVVYRVYEDQGLGVRERYARRQFQRRYRRVHAVRGVSFELHEGESLGIIGANGSGKSTLLAALTGLLPTESGTVRVRSRPTLLGVGAALRLGLSGRRNIVLGCLAAGMTPAEVEAQVDEIIEFSGLADFIDMPMRADSSGMRARLVFSIATARTPDILLIDEALVVGDEAFRQRSLERINEIRGRAGGVILVSHNLNEIKSSCGRALWLDRGVIRAAGPSADVVDEYVAVQHQPARAQGSGGSAPTTP